MQSSTLQFLRNLEKNNNRDWFNENKTLYQEAQQDVISFVEKLIEEMATFDEEVGKVDAKKSLFRIYRDTRFSKDKSPYKLFCSAVVAPNGKKSEAVNGIYFEAGPEALRVYGGIYEIDKDNLLLLREGIAANPDEFDRLKNAPDFRRIFGEIIGEKNKILPADLKAAAEKEPLLYNKQWYFMAEYAPEEILSDKLDQLLEECYMAGKPLEAFFNRFIQRS